MITAYHEEAFAYAFHLVEIQFLNDHVKEITVSPEHLFRWKSVFNQSKCKQVIAWSFELKSNGSHLILFLTFDHT